MAPEVHVQRAGQDELLKMDFLVEIDGLTKTGFKTASGLAREWAEAKTRDGDDPPRKRKQRTSEEIEDLTLTYGVTSDEDELEAWYISGERKSVSLIQRDHLGNEVKRITMFECWPKRREWGDWDADNDTDVQIKTLVLAMEDTE